MDTDFVNLNTITTKSVVGLFMAENSEGIIHMAYVSNAGNEVENNRVYVVKHTGDNWTQIGSSIEGWTVPIYIHLNFYSKYIFCMLFIWVTSINNIRFVYYKIN